MKNDYEILKSRLSWLKFNKAPVNITTSSGRTITGLVRKFDDHSVLLDENGDNDLNLLKAVFYSSIESVCNATSVNLGGGNV